MEKRKKEIGKLLEKKMPGYQITFMINELDKAWIFYAYKDNILKMINYNPHKNCYAVFAMEGQIKSL